MHRRTLRTTAPCFWNVLTSARADARALQLLPAGLPASEVKSTTKTIDIVSGEILFTGVCIENDPKATNFCGNGRDMQLGQERKKALEDALSKSEQ